MSVSSINLFARRRAGVLLHLTSLPGYGARGHLGPDALKFGEWLARAGFSVWQMLPVGPTDNEWSPYQSSSAFAFEPSLAASTDVIHEPSWTTDIDPAAHDWERAAGTFFDGGGSATGRSEYSAFLHRQACWLEDYVLYTSIRSAQSNEPWYRWPVQLRDRDPKTLESFARNHASELNVHRYRQFAIDTQWQGFRRHLNSHGVYLFGDLPIFVAHDSADVWSHRELFLLEPEGVLRTVTGVPPDYFSEDGQRWGQPLYDWSAHAAQGYRWWIERARVQAQRFDLLRLDHFRGFSAC